MTILVRRSTLRRWYGHACALILWVYMATSIIGYYRAWYIATAAVCLFAFFLLLTRTLRIRRLPRAALPVLCYFGWLACSSLWSPYPDATIRWVLIDSIGLGIFCLFYLLAATSDDLVEWFVNLIPPTLVIFVADCLLHPDAIRLGGYSRTVLPFALLFCTHRMMQTWRLRYIVLCILSMVALAVSMTRASVAVAVMGMLLLWLTCGRTQARVRFVAAGMVAAVVFGVVAAGCEPVRLSAARTWVRLTGQGVRVGDTYIRREIPSRTGRMRLTRDALNLLPEHWVRGMGYMAFQPLLARHYGIADGVNLHNSYLSWSLEGGVPCLLIVTWMLRHYLKQAVRPYGIVMVCLLVLAAFYQIHQAPLLWALLGIRTCVTGYSTSK